MLTKYILYFLIFSFIGFLIDSLYILIREGRWTKSGYFKYLPLCPMYGIGGMWLLLFLMATTTLNIYLKIIFGGVLLSICEYVGAIFCEEVLKEKLWDYSKAFANIAGRVDLEHIVCWHLLVGVIAFLIKYKYLEVDFLDFIKVPQITDVAIFFMFILTMITLTIANYNGRKKYTKNFKRMCLNYIKKYKIIK